MRKFISNNKSSSKLSTIISLSLVLFIVGLLSLVVITQNNVSNRMKESIVFTIMLKNYSDSFHNELEQSKRMEFENYLNNTPYFRKDVIFKHKDSAFSELKKDLGEDFSSVLESNPLLDSYDAYVNAEFVSSEGLKEIEEFINNYNGSSVVQDIFYQKNLVEKLNENVKKVRIFLLAFSIIFFLISFALINNSIRLAVYSKRLLIRTMRLVGATNSFIQNHIY